MNGQRSATVVSDTGTVRFRYRLSGPYSC